MEWYNGGKVWWAHLSIIKYKISTQTQQTIILKRHPCRKQKLLHSLKISSVWVSPPPLFALTSILHALRNPVASVLDTRRRIRDAARYGPASASGGALKRLADTAASGAHDASDGVGQATDGVADGRGDEFYARRDA